MIDGKAVAAQMRARIKEEVEQFRAEAGTVPGLAVVLVGDNPASQVYVRMKERACSEVGIYSEKHQLPKEIEQTDLLRLIRRLNQQENIHGILVQLPLPDHLDEQTVIESVDPAKDVDGFHPVNAGRLCAGAPGLVPCTPAAILELIRQTGVSIEGQEAVVVGRSNIVGKPVAMLLLQQNATVTLCHSRTRNLAQTCRRADILVVAVGRPRVITPEFVKSGALVIDVGVNRVSDGGLVGDVDFDGAQQVAGFLTPVPGGVGPMTIAMLLQNTLKAARLLLAG